jgi:hypothetical protein
MTPQEAMDVVGRVQAGQDIEAVLSLVKSGSLLMQLRVAPETRLRYDLPFSQQMPVDLLSSGSPYLASLVYEAMWPPSSSFRTHDVVRFSSQYLKPYHAAVLVEPLLEQVIPSRWTTISRDDKLLKDLLAAYFTREYHLFPVFHKDRFLEDMASGQTDCCSSLLVNTVLAYACVKLLPLIFLTTF